MGVKLYIGQLPRDTTTRDLEKLFRNYGKIESTTAKGPFGFVELADERDAKDAVRDLDGTRFLGHRIIVEYARRRDRDVGPSSTGVNRIIVKNLAPNCTWQDLKDLMKKAGRVLFADVLKDRKGEGVVEFAHREDMKYALRELDNSRLNGQRIILEEADRIRRRNSSRSRSPRRSRSRSRSRSASPSSRRRRDDDRGRDRDSERRSRRDERLRSRSASPDARSKASPTDSREDTMED